jgi:hypothetical protein
MPVARAMSLYSFYFSGHALFPLIYTGMEDRKRFTMVGAMFEDDYAHALIDYYL